LSLQDAFVRLGLVDDHLIRTCSGCRDMDGAWVRVQVRVRTSLQVQVYVFSNTYPACYARLVGGCIQQVQSAKTREMPKCKSERERYFSKTSTVTFRDPSQPTTHSTPHVTDVALSKRRRLHQRKLWFQPTKGTVELALFDCKKRGASA
jgi:hypothetical protein